MLMDAFEEEARARGYEIVRLAINREAEPSVRIDRPSARRIALEMNDYFEDLPDELAQVFAVSVMDYITGSSPWTPSSVRRYVRQHHIGAYIRRSKLIPPEEVKGCDLQAIAERMKAADMIPADVTLVWSPDEYCSRISPTFRIIAVAPFLIEEGEDAIVGSVQADMAVLRTKMERQEVSE